MKREALHTNVQNLYQITPNFNMFYMKNIYTYECFLLVFSALFIHLGYILKVIIKVKHLLKKTRKVINL